MLERTSVYMRGGKNGVWGRRFRRAGYHTVFSMTQCKKTTTKKDGTYFIPKQNICTDGLFVLLFYITALKISHFNSVTCMYSHLLPSLTFFLSLSYHPHSSPISLSHDNNNIWPRVTKPIRSHTLSWIEPIIPPTALREWFNPLRGRERGRLGAQRKCTFWSFWMEIIGYMM